MINASSIAGRVPTPAEQAAQELLAATNKHGGVPRPKLAKPPSKASVPDRLTVLPPLPNPQPPTPPFNFF